MLDKLKLLLNIFNDDSDDLLQTLVSMAKEEIVVYCNLDEYSDNLDFVVIQMVIEKYNRIGSEGLTAQTASGVTNQYDSFYSDKVRRLMNKFRKVKTV